MMGAEINKFIATSLSVVFFGTQVAFGYKPALHPVPGQKTILHIHDVHQNLEVQATISKVLRKLIADKAVGFVGLEGAFGNMRLRRLKSVPEPRVTRLVADYLLEQGQLSGSLHAALTSAGSMPPIVGIDDETAYQANIKAYLAGRESDFSLTPPQWEFQKEKISNRAVLEFYRHAEIRDVEMAKNTIRAAERFKGKRTPLAGVIVTGGFHSPGIDRRLRNAGYKVLSFAPTISNMERFAGVSYMAEFKKGETPAEKLFGDRKFFLPLRQDAHLPDQALLSATLSEKADAIDQMLPGHKLSVVSKKSTDKKTTATWRNKVTGNSFTVGIEHSKSKIKRVTWIHAATYGFVEDAIIRASFQTLTFALFPSLHPAAGLILFALIFASPVMHPKILIGGKLVPAKPTPFQRIKLFMLSITFGAIGLSIQDQTISFLVAGFVHAAYNAYAYFAGKMLAMMDKEVLIEWYWALTKERRERILHVAKPSLEKMSLVRWDESALVKTLKREFSDEKAAWAFPLRNMVKMMEISRGPGPLEKTYALLTTLLFLRSVDASYPYSEIHKKAWHYTTLFALPDRAQFDHLHDTINPIRKKIREMIALFRQTFPPFAPINPSGPITDTWGVGTSLPSFVAMNLAGSGQPISWRDVMKLREKDEEIIPLLFRAGNVPVGALAYRQQLRHLELLSFGVTPPARHSGIGRHMAAHVEKKLFSHGKNWASIIVRESNTNGLIFLRNEGYRTVAVHLNHFQDTGEAGIQMELGNKNPFSVPGSVNNAIGKNRISDHLDDLLGLIPWSPWAKWYREAVIAEKAGEKLPLWKRPAVFAGMGGFVEDTLLRILVMGFFSSLMLLAHLPASDSWSAVAFALAFGSPLFHPRVLIGGNPIPVKPSFGRYARLFFLSLAFYELATWMFPSMPLAAVFAMGALHATYNVIAHYRKSMLGMAVEIVPETGLPSLKWLWEMEPAQRVELADKAREMLVMADDVIETYGPELRQLIDDGTLIDQLLEYGFSEDDALLPPLREQLTEINEKLWPQLDKAKLLLGYLTAIVAADTLEPFSQQYVNDLCAKINPFWNGFGPEQTQWAGEFEEGFERLLLQLNPKNRVAQLVAARGSDELTGIDKVGFYFTYLYTDPDVSVIQEAARSLLFVLGQTAPVEANTREMLEAYTGVLSNDWPEKVSRRSIAVLPTLIHYLNAHNPAVRLQAARALERMGPRAEPALADLMERQKKEKLPDVLTALRRALIAIGRDGKLEKEYIDRIERKIAFENDAAAPTAGDLAFLLNWLKNEGAYADVLHVLDLIGRSGATAAFPPREIMNWGLCDSQAVRDAAMETLSKIGHPSAIIRRTKTSSLPDAPTVGIFGTIPDTAFSLLEEGERHAGTNFIALSPQEIRFDIVNGKKRVYAIAGFVLSNGALSYARFDKPIYLNHLIDFGGLNPLDATELQEFLPADLMVEDYLNSKIATIKILNGRGVPTPRTTKLDDIPLDFEMYKTAGAALTRFLDANDLRQAIVKPDDLSGGEGFRIFSHKVDGAMSFVVRALAAKSPLQIQERVTPQLVTIDGVACDWNVGVYFSHDGHGKPIVHKTKLVRYGPVGRAVNISLSARAVTLEEWAKNLGWTGERLAEESAKLDKLAIDGYTAVVDMARRKGAKNPYIDFGRADIMYRGAGERVIIELNGIASGGFADLDEHTRLVSGNRFASNRIPMHWVNIMTQKARRDFETLKAERLNRAEKIANSANEMKTSKSRHFAHGLAVARLEKLQRTGDKPNAFDRYLLEMAASAETTPEPVRNAIRSFLRTVLIWIVSLVPLLRADNLDLFKFPLIRPALPSKKRKESEEVDTFVEKLERAHVNDLQELAGSAQAFLETVPPAQTVNNLVKAITEQAKNARYEERPMKALLQILDICIGDDRFPNKPAAEAALSILERQPVNDTVMTAMLQRIWNRKIPLSIGTADRFAALLFSRNLPLLLRPINADNTLKLPMSAVDFQQLTDFSASLTDPGRAALVSWALTRFPHFAENDYERQNLFMMLLWCLGSARNPDIFRNSASLNALLEFQTTFWINFYDLPDYRLIMASGMRQGLETGVLRDDDLVFFQAGRWLQHGILQDDNVRHEMFKIHMRLLRNEEYAALSPIYFMAALATGAKFSEADDLRYLFAQRARLVNLEEGLQERMVLRPEQIAEFFSARRLNDAPLTEQFQELYFESDSRRTALRNYFSSSERLAQAVLNRRLLCNPYFDSSWPSDPLDDYALDLIKNRHQELYAMRRHEHWFGADSKGFPALISEWEPPYEPTKGQDDPRYMNALETVLDFSKFSSIDGDIVHRLLDFIQAAERDTDVLRFAEKAKQALDESGLFWIHQRENLNLIFPIELAFSRAQSILANPALKLQRVDGIRRALNRWKILVRDHADEIENHQISDHVFEQLLKVLEITELDPVIIQETTEVFRMLMKFHENRDDAGKWEPRLGAALKKAAALQKARQTAARKAEQKTLRQARKSRSGA